MTRAHLTAAAADGGAAARPGARLLPRPPLHPVLLGHPRGAGQAAGSGRRRRARARGVPVPRPAPAVRGTSPQSTSYGV